MQTDISVENLRLFGKELLNEQNEFKEKVTKVDATDNSNTIACIDLCKHILTMAEKHGLNNSPALEWFADYDKRTNLSDVTCHLLVIKILFSEIKFAIEYQDNSLKKEDSLKKFISSLSDN